MLVKVFTHYVIVPVPVEVPKSNIVPMVTVTLAEKVGPQLIHTVSDHSINTSTLCHGTLF